MKTIIWDLDGTLLDSLATNAPTFAKIFEAREYRPPSRAELEANYHGTLEETIIGLLSAQGLSLPEEELLAIEAEYLELNKMLYKDPQPLLFEDAVRLSERLKETDEYTQIIATNRKHERRGPASPREIVANSSLEHTINHVICGDDGVYRKPDARVLDELDFNVDPNEYTVIGDQHTDALLAKNIGSQCIIVDRAGNAAEFLTAIEDWQDFCQVVKTLDEVEVV